MTYIFQNWNRTKEVTINSQDYPDAYLIVNSAGVCFELLEGERLETGIFQYHYNDYIITAKEDTITVCSMKATFDKFIEDLQDYFCK